MPTSFRAQFFANQTPEWQDHYLPFDRLSALTDGEPVGRSSSVGTLSSRLSRLSEPETPEDSRPLVEGTFAHELLQEMDKVTAFANKMFETGKERMSTITEYGSSPGHDPKLFHRAMVEIYRLFLLLTNYCNVNLAAAHALAETRGRGFYKGFYRRLENAPPGFALLAQNTLPEHVSLVVGIHARFFFNNDVRKAQLDLEIRHQRKPMRFWGVFTLGLYVGLCIPLACMVGWVVCANPFITDAFDWDRFLLVAPVLRAFLLLNILTWLWAGAVFLMNLDRVNHSFVLELDPSTTLSEHHIIRLAAFDLFLWLLFFLLYAGKAQGRLDLTDHSPEFWVKAYVVTWVTLKVLPVSFAFPFATKRWIFSQILEVIAAPALPVTFASNFVGDFLTSTVKVIIDLWYTGCFLWYVDVDTLAGVDNCRLHLSAFIITGLPTWWRMLQCGRRYFDTHDPWHWVNFGKYCVAILAVISGFVWPHYREYSPEWHWGHRAQFLLLVASTLYGFYWDIFKDWALFTRQSDGSWGYRRMVPRLRHSVHFCTVVNLIGRCAWMYTMMVAPPGTRWRTEALNFVTAFLEIYRRVQWSLLRIGNEHWGNVSRYRAVTVAPLKFNDGHVVAHGEASSLSRLEDFLKEVRPLAEKASMRRAEALVTSPIRVPGNLIY